MTIIFAESQFKPAVRCVRTDTGVEIGRSYVPPPQPLGGQAELIQTALLNRRLSDDVNDWRGRLARLGWAVVGLAAFALIGVLAAWRG